MGARKFHLTVTIENEKRLQIRGLLDFITLEISRSKSAVAEQVGMIAHASHGTFKLQFFCHIQPLKTKIVGGFLSGDICVDAPGVVDCGFESR